MAENFCRYYSEIAYPDEVTIGVRIGRLGRSSVRYESGAFRDDADHASAEGHLVHVYVDRASMRPVPIPEHVRTVLITIAV
jgi:acyl-CoA thioester hydrolase